MSVHISLLFESPLSNSPTTCHSEPRMRTVWPMSAPWNWARTPRPTMSSRSPGVKVRPSMILSCGRSTNAAGSTPRRVTLAPLLTSSLRTSSAITMSSAEARGLPSAPTRMPGSCLMMSVVSRSKAELSSASEPPRRITTASLRPVDLSVLSKPAAIASSAVNTATTPARPMTMTSEDAQRSGMLLMLMPVIASAWVNMSGSLLVSCHARMANRLSTAGQCVDDFQASRAQSRKQPDAQSHEHDGHDPKQPHPAVQRQLPLAAGALLHHPPRQRSEQQAEHTPEQAQRERLGQHEAEDSAIGKAQCLQYRELWYALAHALRHGVADHQQQREEHREQDPAYDQADVADLLDEADVELLLCLRLGLVR